MKTTKRILAILTAFVLCLAPMALMVGAAENAFNSMHIYCDHSGANYVISWGEAVTSYIDTIYGTADRCCLIAYINVPMYCPDCDVTFYDTAYKEASHNWANNSVNGAVYCTRCNYYQ